jgi:hypothetical protein
MDTYLSGLTAASERDLRALQVKWTYVGTQRKPLPSLVFTTCFHLLRMDWFEPLRRPGVSYANDASDPWNFTLMPGEMVSLVDSLARLGLTDAAGPGEATISLSAVLRQSRLGDSGAEILLDRAAMEAVVTVTLRVLDERNGVGHQVVTMFWEAVPA